jgi:hypothetical protein
MLRPQLKQPNHLTREFRHPVHNPDRVLLNSAPIDPARHKVPGAVR